MKQGFCDHCSIFPVINYHLFCSSITNTSFDKHRQVVQKLEVLCNQIDSLQAKMTTSWKEGQEEETREGSDLLGLLGQWEWRNQGSW